LWLPSHQQQGLERVQKEEQELRLAPVQALKEGVHGKRA
jgi:hypothetical protein